MTVLTQVLDAAGQGRPITHIARDLRLSPDLVATMVTQGARLGLVQVLDASGCSDGCGNGDGLAPVGPACRGCPIRPRSRGAPGFTPQGSR